MNGQEEIASFSSQKLTPPSADSAATGEPSIFHHQAI